MLEPSVEGNSVTFRPDANNWERMMAIVRHMREIPELPSEAPPKESSSLENVEFPPEGGVLTYMSGQEEPYKGFPFHEMVDKIDLIKKVTRALLSSFFHSSKRRNKLQLLTVILVPWLISDSIRAFVHTFYRVVERFRVKSTMYSTSMRELHRAFSIEHYGEKPQDKDLREQIRDLTCMILEFDNAYRFRFQDIVSELDKVSLRKNPGKELVRLLTLMQSREKQQTVKDTWTLFKAFIPAALFFNRKLRRAIISILESLDLEKIRFSKEDRSYCVPRADYTFGFVENPTPEVAALIARLADKKAKEEARSVVRDESTKAHEALFARHKAEIAVPAEMEAQIVQETNEYLAQCNIEGNQKFEEGRKRILRNHLTEEQLKTIDRHNKEREIMDDEFTKKLTAVG